MAILINSWAAEPQFIGRVDELARLERWWAGTDAEPINLFGRRRIGKSWLFRKFAHGKPAILLVAEKTTLTQQLAKLADQLEPLMVARPEIKDIATLFRILYQLAKTERTLVVIDEFPNLLGTSRAEIGEALSSVQTTMEQHRDESKIKLILCGSAVAQMEALQAERSPLHGRLQRFALAPLAFSEARPFFDTDDVTDQLTRFSVTGGMPRYLSMLGRGDFVQTLSDGVVDRNAPLFNEVMSLLQAEVREPATYLAILSELAIKPKGTGSISLQVGEETKKLSPYLEVLEAMRLVKQRRPVGADPKSRTVLWACDDGFIRFWFRFVAPFQADLEAGGNPLAHVNKHIIPLMADHTSPNFEDLFRRWVRQQYTGASQVDAWWGNSLNALRQTRERTSEEIDAVGLDKKNVVVVGEAKWTNEPLSLDVLTDLWKYKVPALQQGGFKIPKDYQVVLASRSGFTLGVQEAASKNMNIRLVTATDLLNQVR